ncbi:MAG: hypothetical protein V1863_07520 [Candidatus Omnitrophota bacterium]
MRAFFVAIESLLNPDLAAEFWPASITSDKAFLEQIRQRRELKERLEDVVNSLPRADMPIEVAISQGFLTEEQVADLYDSLSMLFESGWDYMRLVLYLPFEFLPSKKWHPSGMRIQQASDRFRRIYLKAWKRLLSVHDVRANFVDGDVLELERRVGDLPRVVKAAHLIPKLVEGGVLEVRDATRIIAESGDPVLRGSMADMIPALADLRSASIYSGVRIVVSSSETIASAQGRLDAESARIEAEELRDVTPKRKIWLKEKKKERAIETLGEDISATILRGIFTDEMATSFFSYDTSVANKQALVEGIRKAIESVARTDSEKAQKLYERYAAVLLKLWEDADQNVKETLLKSFRHFHQLRIVRDEQLAELRIFIPKLAGPFSENLELMKEEVRDIQNMIDRVKLNAELSQLIYPVVLMFGSGLNGYGEESSDIDLSVFVRPGTPFIKRARLKELLRETFVHERIRSAEIIEFWLEKKGDELSVRDFDKPDVSLGESHWMHILFGAAWLGNKDVMRELCEKLLVPYMRRDAHRLCLEDMEQSALQYRLMHKGYKRFFPPQGGIHTPHADGIDGQSVFWDSGYRQLAARLFVSRVFLPKIPVLFNEK